MSLPNTNPTTGLPYGVISANSLDPDVAQELWLKASEASCKDFLDTRTAHWEREIVESLNELGGDIEPTTPGVQDLAMHLAEQDAEDFQDEEPCAEITLYGITVVVSYLGGAMLVTSCDGPVVQVRSYCSPCVPRAADLDSGYGSIECHGFPMEWFTDEAWGKLTNEDTED